MISLPPGKASPATIVSFMPRSTERLGRLRSKFLAWVAVAVLRWLDSTAPSTRHGRARALTRGFGGRLSTERLGQLKHRFLAWGAAWARLWHLPAARFMPFGRAKGSTKGFGGRLS